jgi:(p)ppGpp synthase/HD superfamily hydrolase
VKPIFHPIAVARVASNWFKRYFYCSCITDVVEDTPTTIQDIEFV